MGLEQLLVAQGVAGVVAHVDCGHLGDVEGVILSEVLWAKNDDEQTGQLVSEFPRNNISFPGASSSLTSPTLQSNSLQLPGMLASFTGRMLTWQKARFQRDDLIESKG